MRIAVTAALAMMVVGAGTVRAEEILRAESSLTKDTPRDSIKAWGKTHEVTLRSGAGYQLYVQCGTHGSCLEIVDPAGKRIARDQGYGGVRIPLRAAQDGAYRVTASMPLSNERGGAYLLAVSETTMTSDERITATDPGDFKNKDAPCKRHEVKLTEGTLYAFHVDGFVRMRVEDSTGAELGKADFNRTIVVKCPKSDTYRVIVTGPPNPKEPVKYQLVVGRVVSRTEGQITSDDAAARVPRESHANAHEVKLQANQTYLIRMASKQIDSFIRLEDANGFALAMDDDGGASFDALLVFKPPKDGTYRIVATTFAGPMLGSYVVTVNTKP